MMIPWIQSRRLRTLGFIFIFTTRIATTAQDLTEVQMDLVNMRVAESSRATWELGLRTQAILERNAPSYSVFSGKPLPPSSNPDSDTLKALQPLFGVVDNAVASHRDDSPQPLMADPGSAADPVSLGVAVLVSNLTRNANRGLNYAGAAKSQIDYLYRVVRKTPDGAFSHRVSETQMWSDSVYMVPPYLAYYGVMTRDLSIAREAYNQIRLYRNYLRDPQQSCWKHIVGMNNQQIDPGFWSTGNGWAAAGILRVYATLQNSEYAPSLRAELQNLATWVQEIHRGMYSRGNFDDTTKMFNNYVGVGTNRQGNFNDAASTALLASTVYRAAKILGQTDYLPFAESSRKALSASGAHFTGNMVLFPVVDPYRVNQQLRPGQVSPEAQAFVVLMHQAWMDWK